MHPDDVAVLFERVAVGTPGRIVYRPALLAALPDGRVFVEVNRDEYRLGPEPVAALRALAESRGLAERIDWQRVAAVAAAREGIAREVTLQPLAARNEPGHLDSTGDPAR